MGRRDKLGHAWRIILGNAETATEQDVRSHRKVARAFQHPRIAYGRRIRGRSSFL